MKIGRKTRIFKKLLKCSNCFFSVYSIVKIFYGFLEFLMFLFDNTSFFLSFFGSFSLFFLPGFLLLGFNSCLHQSSSFFFFCVFLLSHLGLFAGFLLLLLLSVCLYNLSLLFLSLGGFSFLVFLSGFFL